MSAPGWYPDPGGQPGMFRYWDGAAWSAMLSEQPQSPAPGTQGGVAPGPGIDQHGGAADAAPRSRGWLIAAGVILVVMVVVIGLFVRGVSQGGFSSGDGERTNPIEEPVCPPLNFDTPTQGAVRDGRVHGGLLSYPLLPEPWSVPSTEVRVPYGFNAWSQNIPVDSYESNGQIYGWVSSVMISELRAGDGFFHPEEGARILTTCIVGGFYGDAKVTRNDTVNKAVQVDGHEGWLIETELSFRIPGLRTEGEWLAVLVVDTGEGRSSLYSASIPDTSPQWQAPARQAMADLRVD